MKALRSQVASTGKPGDDWAFDVSGEQVEQDLVDEVVHAFEKYLREFPDRRHLAPPSRLGEAEVLFKIVSSPRHLDSGSSSLQNEVNEFSAQNGFENDLLIPAYDLIKLGVADRLGQLKLGLDSQHFSTFGVLQHKQALQLHLVLQKLALFLGQRAPHHWIKVRK